VAAIQVHSLDKDVAEDVTATALRSRGKQDLGACDGSFSTT